MTDDQRQRLLHWVELAGREHGDIDGGFEIAAVEGGHSYRISFDNTITIEADGEFEFSSSDIRAVERYLVLRLGVEGRIGTAEPLRLPWSVLDLPGQFVLAADRADPGVWVLERQDRTVVARIRRDAAVEFSCVAEADPELVRQSLLHPKGLPLFGVPAAPPAPIPVPVVDVSEPHTRPRQCPGPYRSQCDAVSLGSWEFLVRCTQCGALFSIGLADYSGVVAMSRRRARKRFPEAKL